MTATATQRLSKAHRTALQLAAQNLSQVYIIRAIENQTTGHFTGALRDAPLDAVKAWLKNYRPNRDSAKEAARKALYRLKGPDTPERFRQVVKYLTVEKIKAWLKLNPKHTFCRPGEDHAGNCLVADYLRACGFSRNRTGVRNAYLTKHDPLGVHLPPEITNLILNFDIDWQRNETGAAVYSRLFT
jgi:hypothetical protein